MTPSSSRPTWTPSAAARTRRYQVDRKTIRRDLQELVRRGQLPASVLTDEA